MKFGPQRIAWLMVCVVAAGLVTPVLSGLLFVTVFFLRSPVNVLGLMAIVSLVLSSMLFTAFGVFRRIDGWRASVGAAAAVAALGLVATFVSYYVLALAARH